MPNAGVTFGGRNVERRGYGKQTKGPSNAIRLVPETSAFKGIQQGRHSAQPSLLDIVVFMSK